MENRDLNRLKVVLAERKITNKWLAEQLGKDQGTISKWCTNTSQPDLANLMKIAELLNVDLNELVRFENNKQLLNVEKMAITPITKEAFAVLAMCEETKKPFGITIDPQGQMLKFVWAFKIDKEKAHREHFDSQKVRGSIVLDDNFQGCPHCHSKHFYICSGCGTISCYHGQRYVTCPSCGASGEIQAVESIELKGGGY